METPFEELGYQPRRRAKRGGAALAGASGAPPSNRAPDSSNSHVYTMLSRHVDSLDLSYPGRLNPAVDRELQTLKHHAQSRDDEYQALAQLVRGDHALAVQDKGYRRFPYVLRDDFFRITLAAASSESLPMAVCQVRNYALMSLGPERCEARLRALLSELGELAGDAVVGRVDLAVDVSTSADLEDWDRRSWITRIRAKRKHADGDLFSGWDVGCHGDPASFGLYDKTLEIGLHGEKAYMHEVWERAGAPPWETVWRAEARLRREYLRRFGLRTLPEVLRAIPALWKEFTTETLRLTVPVPGDQTRSRWPNHALWDFLQNVDWKIPFGPITRAPRKIGAPSNEYFARGLISLMTSWMGREGNWDPGQALPALERIAYEHLAAQRPITDLLPDEGLIARARVKGVRYGTRVAEGGSTPAPPLRKGAAAQAYRDVSRGS
jgi:hypothetical protein